MKVLITGASSGIGRSMAYIFAKKNYDLILVARTKDKLENIKKEINNVNVEIKVCDLTNIEECKNLHKEYPNIDILVNNAGFGLVGSFEKIDLDKELKMIDTNIKAVHILTKLYLKNFIKKDKGQILNVASISGFLPGPLMATYYSTKNYIVCLSESLKEELRRKKFHVQISILCPGPVNTNFNNVANVKFNIGPLTSEYASKVAIEGMFQNKLMIIPNNMKVNHLLTKIAPTKIVLKVISMVQERRSLLVEQKMKRNFDKE